MKTTGQIGETAANRAALEQSMSSGDCPKVVGGFMGLSAHRVLSSEDVREADRLLRNPFCTLIKESPGGEAFCRGVYEKARREACATGRAVPVACPLGLAALAIPAAEGGGCVGPLLAGEIRLHARAQARLDRLFSSNQAQGQGLGLAALWESYYHTPVPSPELLHVLAHLGDLVAHRSDAHGGGTAITLRESCPPAPPASGKRCGCVRRAKTIIDERFRENLRLGGVAREVGASPWHLSHLFKAQTGISFKQCLTNARVAALKRLLIESGLSITDAIFETGFQSISQGNRSFRSVVGMSPRAFRGRAR